MCRCIGYSEKEFVEDRARLVSTKCLYKFCFNFAKLGGCERERERERERENCMLKCVFSGLIVLKLRSFLFLFFHVEFYQFVIWFLNKLGVVS